MINPDGDLWPFYDLTDEGVWPLVNWVYQLLAVLPIDVEVWSGYGQKVRWEQVRLGDETKMWVGVWTWVPSLSFNGSRGLPDMWPRKWRSEGPGRNDDSDEKLGESHQNRGRGNRCMKNRFYDTMQRGFGLNFLLGSEVRTIDFKLWFSFLVRTYHVAFLISFVFDL